MPLTTPCPDLDVLEQFAAGRLSEMDHARYERHVLECAACQDRLATLDSYTDELDGLIDCVPAVVSLSELGRGGNGRTLKGARSDTPGGGSMALMPEVLGDFRIVREIGHGGMGIVYEAIQIGLNRKVALKVLPFVNLLDPNRLKRFQNESRAAASLDHPNIVPVIAVGEDRQIHFYAMRYINGPNLSQVVQLLSETTNTEMNGNAGEAGGAARNRPGSQTTVAFFAHGEGAKVPPPRSDRALEATSESVHQVRYDGSVEKVNRSLVQPFTQFEPMSAEYVNVVANIGIHTARALAYAHENGVVHRDIKPSNLMCDEKGRLWITDFGLARIESDAASTAGRPIQGTPRYMSPEQSIGRRGVVDHRTDVYSLGVTLYELLTLTPIFPDAAQEELLTCIQRDEPKAPRLINPRIPRDLETIVLSAMSKEPRDRYNTASEFADDLTRFLEHKPIRARRPTLKERAAKWVRRHPSSLSVAAGFAAVVLAATAGLLIYSGRLDQANKDLKAAQKIANDALEVAKTSEEEARNSEYRARQQIYAQDLRQASVALGEFDAWQAFRLLETHIPKPGEDDLRGFEWALLWNRCNGKGFTIPVSDLPLYDVRYSPDNRYVSVTGQETKVRVWDASNWNLWRTFETDQVEINSAAISPDGKTLATSGDDGSIRFIDFERRIERKKIEKAHVPKAYNIAFITDGKQLLSCGDDQYIRIWNTQTGADEGRFEGHTDVISHFVVSDDGQFLISASSDQTIRIWKLADRSLVKVLNAKGGGRISSVAISPDNTRIASASINNTLWIWNRETGEREQLAKLRDTVQATVFLDGSKRLIASDRSGTLHLFELRPAISVDTKDPKNALGPHPPVGVEVAAWLCHNDRAQSLAVTSDNSKVLSAGWNGKLRVLDLRTSSDDSRIPVPLHGRPQSFRFSQHDEIIYCGTSGAGPTQCAYVFDPVTGSERKVENKTHFPLTCAALSPDGKTAYLGHATGRITVHRAEGSAEPVVWDLSSAAEVSEIVATPDGKYLIAGLPEDEKDCVRVFELPSGKRLTEFPVHDGRYLVLSPDGHTLGFSFTRDAFIWNLLSPGGNPKRIPGQLSMRRLAFSNDGRHFAISGEEREIEIREVANPNIPSKPMTGHAAEVFILAFSPDGQTLVSGDRAGLIKFWHVPSGRHLLDFVQLGDSNLNMIAFSPGGRFLAYSHSRADGDSIVIHDLAKIHADAQMGIDP